MWYCQLHIGKVSRGFPVASAHLINANITDIAAEDDEDVQRTVGSERKARNDKNMELYEP